MSYPPEDQPRAFSVLVGREVSTWSEEWKHECEVRYLAEMTLAQRNEVFDGSPGGMRFKRGEAAVMRLRAEIDRYAELLAGAP